MTYSGIWSPEDDLLLKNAVEAGASLQALAKGAISFSRRYSYKELQDRWHSLLYDPVVSKLSCIGMLEVELSGTCPTTKSIKSEYCKAHKDLQEVRKRGSIRKKYYDMRKKSRIDFFSSADLLFLNVPTLQESHNHGSNSREHHDDLFSPHDLGLQEDDLDILHKVFPEAITGYASSSDYRDKINEYPAECTISIGNNCQNGTRNGFPLNFSNSVRVDERETPMASAKCFDISHGIRNSVPSFGKCAAAEGPGIVQVLLGKRLPMSSEEKQLSPSYSCHDNSQSICGFRGSQNVTSLNSEGNFLLQVIGFPSPQQDFPLWNNMEDCLSPSFPVCIRDQDTTNVASMMLQDDVTITGESVSDFNIVHSVPFVGVEGSSSEFMNSSVVSDSDIVGLPENLLNLANEDEMTFMSENQEDAVDKTIKAYHPAFVQEEGKVEHEPEILMVEEPRSNVSNGILPTMFETIAPRPRNEQTIVCHLDNNPPSSVIDENVASVSGTRIIHELDCSVICCMLSTEDLEIPCNDDIFLLIHPSPAFSSSPPFSGEALDMTSSTIGNASTIDLSSKEEDNIDSLQWHPDLRSSSSQDIHLGKPCLDCVVKSKSSDLRVRPVNSSKEPAISCQYRSSNGFTDRLPGHNFLNAHAEVTLASLEEMPVCAEGGHHREQVPQQAINGAASDPKESQSDDNVPCTSDVETMILQMDLDPPEEENSISIQNRLSGRARYLSEETKRTVMRLEQCTQSVLRRTLTSQGAFAILYGRRLKHYIRKTLVLVGRSTDDVDVDIDLSKEWRANKPSRRQAIIKMKADGCFYLRNIGKRNISVNGRPAASGKSLILSSGCLIEIARMSFVFEICKKNVQQYMNIIAQEVNEHDKFQV